MRCAGTSGGGKRKVVWRCELCAQGYLPALDRGRKPAYGISSMMRRSMMARTDSIGLGILPPLLV